MSSDHRPADRDRLRLYRYLSVPETADYLAIMSHFTSALLAEWSAQDLCDLRLDLPPDVVEARLRFLADNGNVLRSPREVRVTSIAEYQRQPARYTVSTLGARVHREVEALLAAAGGGREVPRELLALVAEGLTALAEGPGNDPSAADARSVAERVSTVFLQFAEFAASVTDFYTYVGTVLSRTDLDGDEWVGFKHLLLDYLETIVEGVARHTPAIRSALVRLEPVLPALLARLDDEASPFEVLRAASPGGESVERARGRSLADWEQLRSWFGAGTGFGEHGVSSGARELREAAGRAVGALLANLKRINAAATRETSLRRHLLKLAGWFDAAAPDEAHVLYTSAFALYSARHLSVPLEPSVAESLPATTSWWSAPPAPVPVSLRERGDRSPRGRVSPAADHSRQRERLVAGRQAEALRRADACTELLAAGRQLDRVRLSVPAMQVLLELIAAATATMGSDGGLAWATLLDRPMTVWLLPSGPATTVRSGGGDLTVHGLRVVVTVVGESPDLEATSLARGAQQ